MVLVLHILGFVTILVPLIHLAPRSTSSEVFAVFSNGGGWSSQGLSFVIGLLGDATDFLGRLQTLTSFCMRANLYEGTDGPFMYVNSVTAFSEFIRTGQHIPTPSSRFRS